MKLSLKQLWFRIPPSWYRHLLGRSILFLLFAGALALQGWSWTIRYPTIDRIERQIQQAYRLDNEVQDLELKWSEPAAAQLQAKLAEADQLLFGRGDDLADWLATASRRSNDWRLVISPQLQPNQPHPRHQEALLLTPVVLDIQPLAGGRTNVAAYSRLLDYLQHLATNSVKRVDPVELTIHGNGRAMNQAKLGLQFWSLAGADLASTNLLGTNLVNANSLGTNRVNPN